MRLQPSSIISYAPESLCAHMAGVLASAKTPWVTEIRYTGGPTFFITVRSALDAGNSPKDGLSAALLAADLFRPGWAELSRPVPDPMIRGEMIYRGFRMHRSATVAEYGGEWIVDCLIATRLADRFDWSTSIERLEAFHAAVFSEDASHE